ncbi:Protein of unknown function [Lutibacter agarilyticus]|uniref:DUF2891 domain-containing protein n=1 Tax=Lutibacter agarilyticus TaxID=1109740 RepID=A0A238W6L7_9FLAO|nr:DUF2891 domain-containing protein [Lutibacter agarilyticus]SNR42071.1 Protein of unknown function [Lutibacter agarilyticus]
MKKIIITITVFSFILACKKSTKSSQNVVIIEEVIYPKPVLNTKSADYLYHFAFDCIDQEYPNKLGQVLGDASYLKEPSELHPAFYGCFDWHSSVHGHWALLNIMKEIPSFEGNDAILKKLQTTITKENILKEVAYFDDVHNKTFERTYGWAWLLKVAETLRDWNTVEANQMSQNLEPLVQLVELKYLEFLPKLPYPIRVGEHTNTAFGMSFALDYAKKYAPELAETIRLKAKEYYFNDKGCPISWEPSGFDFLSPCLQEASLMLKVLPEEEFIPWLDAFLPDFRSNPAAYLQVAQVTDRSDGKLAHLDGLNFSRAWCLYEIGIALKNDEMINLANKHFDYSYKKMDSGEYAGAHWLASFALYAILKSD